LSNVLPFSESWRLLEEKYNRDNWRESYGLYTVGTVDVICGIWQLGWVGGGMVTQPLLMAGSEPSQERACRNLDTIIHRSQAPSGLFYGAGDGKNWYSDAFADPHPDRMVMIRKNADWLYFLGKQIKLLSTLRFGWTLPEHWKTAYRRLADAFVNLWNRYGQLGQFADVETGELVVGMTTSGVMASGGLMLAAEILNDPKYLEVAEQSARLYYGRDVKTGITNAGPGEILQAPDSESAFAALESFIVLYEGTKKREWLLAATDTARQCATWCVSYDYQFPPESLFAKLDIRTTGAVYANAQNKHGAPGICTLSGDSLLKLFRATGDRVFIELLRDIAHMVPQCISRPDRPMIDQPSGWINERVNLSDWEGKSNVGNIFHGSCWPEVSMMLTWIEVPGVYVQTDTGLVFAIDHVEASLTNDSGNQWLILRNPTNYPATVRLLVETSRQAAEPLGFNAMLNRPTVTLDPGMKKTILLQDIDSYKEI
jgi:hypothetical protein